jgi:hypothetical protein
MQQSGIWQPSGPPGHGSSYRLPPARRQDCWSVFLMHCRVSCELGPLCLCNLLYRNTSVFKGIGYCSAVASLCDGSNSGCIACVLVSCSRRVRYTYTGAALYKSNITMTLRMDCIHWLTEAAYTALLTLLNCVCETTSVFITSVSDQLCLSEIREDTDRASLRNVVYLECWILVRNRINSNFSDSNNSNSDSKYFIILSDNCLSQLLPLLRCACGWSAEWC